MLIDTGTPESGTAIRLFLKMHGVEKLDYLVLTHPDADHIGGTASVITNVSVDQVLMPDYTKDNEIYLGIMDALDYKYLKPYAPAPDETLAETQESETGDYKYVKNTNSHRFHLPACDSVKDMKEKNKEYSDQSRDEIIAEGYKPCQRCTP